MLQHVDIERLIGHDPFQTRVLGLELLEPFRVIGFHAPVLGEPPMPRRLGNPELSAHLLHRHTTSHQLVALRQLADDLLRRMTALFPRHGLHCPSSWASIVLPEQPAHPKGLSSQPRYSVYSFSVSSAHVLLGLLSRGNRHGYELKREHDAYFPAARPLAFGQVYATLDRLAGRAHVAQVDTVRVDGPDRRVFSLTKSGRAELATWLRSIEPPAPYVTNPFATKATVALLAGDERLAASYLRRQREAHLERMRHYTRVKTNPAMPFAEALAADYAIAHLDADIQWLETAVLRIDEIAKSLHEDRAHDTNSR